QPFRRHDCDLVSYRGNDRPGGTILGRTAREFPRRGSVRFLRGICHDQCPDSTTAPATTRKGMRLARHGTTSEVDELLHKGPLTAGLDHPRLEVAGPVRGASR